MVRRSSYLQVYVTTPLTYKMSNVQLFSFFSPLLTVVVVDCGVLDPPAFGKVLITGTTAGSTARYSCFPTYALVGDAQRRCQQDSQWSGSEPVCKCKTNHIIIHSSLTLYIKVLCCFVVCV